MVGYPLGTALPVQLHEGIDPGQDDASVLPVRVCGGGQRHHHLHRSEVQRFRHDLDGLTQIGRLMETDLIRRRRAHGMVRQFDGELVPHLVHPSHHLAATWWTSPN